MNFNILQKPETSGDQREQYRWFYRICEILNDLGNIIALGTGFLVKTATGTYAVRTITGTANEVTVANGDGVAGNPTIDLPTVISTPRKFGDGTNQTAFEADGTMVAEGTATVWNDIFIDGLSVTGGATDPPIFAAFIGTVYANRFDNGATMSSHGSFELQHDYKEGTDLAFHIHWSPTTTNVGDVVWGIEYTIVNRNGVFPATTTVTAALAAGGVANAHNSQNIAVLSGAGITIGAVMRFRIFRSGAAATDTFTGEAFLHRIGIHYECDTLGSRGVTAK